MEIWASLIVSSVVYKNQPKQPKRYELTRITQLIARNHNRTKTETTRTYVLYLLIEMNRKTTKLILTSQNRDFAIR